MEFGSYKLVAEIHAHDGPVRSLHHGGPMSIVSGCQSSSPNAKSWCLMENSMIQTNSDLSHSHWVTAVTTLAPSHLETYPEGLIITGCMDSVIRVFNMSGELMLTLEGHTKGVISLSWTSDSKLLSGSWDGTAKMWDLELGGCCLQTFGPQENGVHVISIQHEGRELILTTSTGESVNEKPANFQVRLWDKETGLQVGQSLRDHLGPIRAVCPVPGLGSSSFATASNDGTIVVRSDFSPSPSLSSAPLFVLSHPPQLGDDFPPFILDCQSLGGSDLVSCGEDGTVCVWEAGSTGGGGGGGGYFDTLLPSQCIPHPCSVWCVATGCTPTREQSSPSSSSSSTTTPTTTLYPYFLTGGHDGVIRIFSSDPSWTSSSQSIQLQSQFQRDVEESENNKEEEEEEEEE